MLIITRFDLKSASSFPMMRVFVERSFVLVHTLALLARCWRSINEIGRAYLSFRLAATAFCQCVGLSWKLKYHQWFVLHEHVHLGFSGTVEKLHRFDRYKGAFLDTILTCIERGTFAVMRKQPWPISSRATRSELRHYLSAIHGPNDCTNENFQDCPEMSTMWPDRFRFRSCLTSDNGIVC